MTVRLMNPPVPDDGYTVADLIPFGWAPGNYWFRACRDCGDEYTGDKRCRRCRPCAVKAFEVERAEPVPILHTEFWWITSKAWGLPEPIPARVTFKDGTAAEIRALGEDEWFGPGDCTLVERMSPPATVFDPGEAAHARCAEECRELAAGEPECTDTCRRADAARRKA